MTLFSEAAGLNDAHDPAVMRKLNNLEHRAIEPFTQFALHK